MGAFTNKIDFEVVIMVNHGNPNGDPLNGNRPREDFDGFGEISDVCLKRKIRNRLQDMGEKIFIQSEERCDDGCKSLADRTKTNDEMQKALKAKDNEAYAKAACKTWIDVRAFGQVFAFKGNSVSVGVRGPVTIQSAFSVDPIDIESIQITKSVNSETSDKRGADTGFSDEDAEKIKEALRTLFENDASSARPDGSMEVVRVYWWKHNCPMGQYSSAKVHRLLKIEKKTEFPKSIDDYEFTLNSLPGLEVEIIEGI